MTFEQWMIEARFYALKRWKSEVEISEFVMREFYDLDYDVEDAVDEFMKSTEAL